MLCGAALAAPVPDAAAVAEAYRAHVERGNADMVEMMGREKARHFVVRLVDLQPAFCEFHSGQSHVCHIVVSQEIDGRVGRRLAGDLLMTPDGSGGWKMRLLRRPR